MIFLCFAAKDRYTIAESVLYHLENFGVPVWYDRHELLIGDNRQNVNFEEGILSNKYSILLITKNIETNICANEEIETVKNQYYKNEMTVFPILYNIQASELPKKYEWMKEIIYREVTDKTGTLIAVSNLVYHYLKDIVAELEYKTILDYIQRNSKNIHEEYIRSLLNTYLDIDHNNLNARISMLYSAYLYIQTSKRKFPFYCNKPFSFLYSLCKLNIGIDFMELRILESALLIMLNNMPFR